MSKDNSLLSKILAIDDSIWSLVLIIGTPKAYNLVMLLTGGAMCVMTPGLWALSIMGWVGVTTWRIPGTEDDRPNPWFPYPYKVIENDDWRADSPHLNPWMG
jgi:hypothetical protein